ncbi:hypothetical protein KJ359_000893 [Pestalotiopsis sp. 9143b]|nr:hypothetical protein KJ359_000893 [Pestalotiopsis sp. 9143b]
MAPSAISEVPPTVLPSKAEDQVQQSDAGVPLAARDGLDKTPLEAISHGTALPAPDVDEPAGAHFGMMTAGDLICLDINTGRVAGGNASRPANAAGFLIHSAVHKRRPADIHAICHFHTDAGRAWSAFARPLDMLSQDICNFHNAHAVYADYGGIVFGSSEGERIADALGPHNKGAILMNHGLLTVGWTVDEAGFMFGLLDRGCRIQLQVEAAAAAGLKKNIISDEEAAYNFTMASEKNALYREAQPDLEYEIMLAGGEEVVAKGYDALSPLQL